MTFAADLSTEILRHLSSTQDASGYDELRFGKMKLKRRIENGINRLARRTGRSWLRTASISHFLEQLEGEDEKLSALYEALADDASKELLLRLFAYRALGFQHVRLPLATEEYRRKRKQLGKLFTGEEIRDIPSLGMQLRRCRLHELGAPIEMFGLLAGLECVFSVKQYEYEGEHGRLAAGAGDVVIDAGGCWGDTALYFADRVGPEGHVFVFEFIPSNLTILRENLALNPELEGRIQVVDRPVWDQSGVELSFEDKGPASRVSLDSSPERDGVTQTLSIDDLVAQEKLERVDFIKMDVEGAEPWALRGARETIRRFRPTLAISVYHSIGDFGEVYRIIADICPEYRFTLGHATMHQEETVLFAEAR